MNTGKTKNLGVMGWPIAHSLSPAMQQAAIEKAGIDYSYVALPVEPEQLPQAVEGLKALNFSGWNVTIPHKRAIMPLLDEIDEDAAVIGAVNTVVNDGGRLKGYNTDVLGFLSPLKARGIKLAGARALLLGAGGAARAVLWGLLREGAAAVTLVVRNSDKGEALAAEFRSRAEAEITVCTFDSEGYKAALSTADILVNTTPLGMTPKVEEAPSVEWELVKSSAFVYDIIYTPAETRFLREAREHGCQVQNGEAMLAGQGAAALQLWAGIEPDADCMCRALREELSKR